MCFKLSKYVCCTLDLTIASRIIAFIGVAISVILMTVLVNDKYLSQKDNYDISRKTALAFGLDWRHFYENASISAEDDPEGRMVSIIVTFYSTAFLFINLLLFFGSIKLEWCCALPWLCCELVGCLSKFGALVYHWNCEPFHMTNVFIVGSIIYIGVTIWWWLVIFSAQQLWKRSKLMDVDVEMTSVLSYQSPKKPQMSQKTPTRPNNLRDSIFVDSPGPYQPNMMYSLI